MHDVGSAVAVEITHQLQAIGDGIAAPWAEGADVEAYWKELIEPMSRPEASLFFRLVSYRYGRGAIMITTAGG